MAAGVGGRSRPSIGWDGIRVGKRSEERESQTRGSEGGRDGSSRTDTHPAPHAQEQPRPHEVRGFHRPRALASSRNFDLVCIAIATYRSPRCQSGAESRRVERRAVRG